MKRIAESGVCDDNFGERIWKRIRDGLLFEGSQDDWHSR
jgi:hypothetical protein